MDDASVVICPECDSGTVYRYDKQVASGGGYGPDLLPGLARNSLAVAKMVVTVCAACGLIRLYAYEAARKRLATSASWHEAKP